MRGVDYVKAKSRDFCLIPGALLLFYDMPSFRFEGIYRTDAMGRGCTKDARGLERG